MISSDLREQAWPKLLGVGRERVDPILAHCCDRENDRGLDDSAKEVEAPFADLLSIDVNRAVYFRYACSTGREPNPSGEGDKSSAQQKLKELISSSMEQLDHGEFSYYQGFHDVASVLLVNISNMDSASSLLSQVARNYLHDAMRKDFSALTLLLTSTFYPLLHRIDTDLHDYLFDREVQPTIVLPWIITLFSHDIHDCNVSSRLFDAIFASHPLFPMYVSMAILTHEVNREALFDPEYDDPMMLQVVLKRLALNITDDGSGSTGGQVTVQSIIDQAMQFE